MSTKTAPKRTESKPAVVDEAGTERVSFMLPKALYDTLLAEAESEGLMLPSHLRRILTLRHNTLAAQTQDSG
jgi:hypothetical protein